MYIQEQETLPVRYLVVQLNPARHSKVMLFIREGWIRSMFVYTKPHDQAVYTELRLHPKYDVLAPIEFREWLRYSTTNDINSARENSLRHKYTRVIRRDYN